MVQQDKIQGLPVPGGDGHSVKVATIVDDTTVFLRRTKALPRLLHTLAVFHELSGLRVQPKKSVLIVLNTAVQQRELAGIPVIATGATTRYLGVEVGHTRANAENWQKRLTGLKARPAVAARFATSVIERVKILNSISLPAILFTAQFSRASDKTLQDLENLQKQFLQARKLTTEGRKHKMNPGLLFSPIRAGGMGLLSIRVAIKTLLMRRATGWLLADDSIYKTCWQHLLLKMRRLVNTMTLSETPRRWKKRDEDKATAQADGLELVDRHWTSGSDQPGGGQLHSSNSARCKR